MELLTIEEMAELMSQAKAEGTLLFYAVFWAIVYGSIAAATINAVVKYCNREHRDPVRVIALIVISVILLVVFPFTLL